MKRNFKPRNFTAVFLSIIWFLVSVSFVIQGMMVQLWIGFAGVALIIGGLAVWVLFTDTYDREQ